MLAMYLAMLETEEDQRRFTRLYRAYEKTVYAAALRVLGNRTQAEDEALVTVKVLPSDPALLEQAAESVEPWNGESMEYTAGWAPEEYEEVMHSFSSGVGEWEWVRNRTPLDLLYINDPLCPFRVPDRASEAVTVNGLPGRFWPAIFTREEWDARIAEDPAPTTFMECDLQARAILTWEDPETSTSFRISGIGEKEDFLRMAESVTRK